MKLFIGRFPQLQGVKFWIVFMESDDNLISFVKLLIFQARAKWFLYFNVQGEESNQYRFLGIKLLDCD